MKKTILNVNVNTKLKWFLYRHTHTQHELWSNALVTQLIYLGMVCSYYLVPDTCPYGQSNGNNNIANPIVAGIIWSGIINVKKHNHCNCLCILVSVAIHRAGSYRFISVSLLSPIDVASYFLHIYHHHHHYIWLIIRFHQNEI